MARPGAAPAPALEAAARPAALPFCAAVLGRCPARLSCAAVLRRCSAPLFCAAVLRGRSAPVYQVLRSGCASVLNTTRSKSSVAGGANRRYAYFSVSARKKLSIWSRCSLVTTLLSAA